MSNGGEENPPEIYRRWGQSIRDTGVQILAKHCTIFSYKKLIYKKLSIRQPKI